MIQQRVFSSVKSLKGSQPGADLGEGPVDYVISDIDNLRLNVEFLLANSLQPDISDRCGISYGIKINAADKNNSSNTCKTKMHKTVMINEEVKKNTPVILQSKEYKDKLD